MDLIRFINVLENCLKESAEYGNWLESRVGEYNRLVKWMKDCREMENAKRDKEKKELEMVQQEMNELQSKLNKVLSLAKQVRCVEDNIVDNRQMDGNVKVKWMKWKVPKSIRSVREEIQKLEQKENVCSRFQNNIDVAFSRMHRPGRANSIVVPFDKQLKILVQAMEERVLYLEENMTLESRRMVDALQSDNYLKVFPSYYRYHRMKKWINDCKEELAVHENVLPDTPTLDTNALSYRDFIFGEMESCKAPNSNLIVEQSEDSSCAEAYVASMYEKLNSACEESITIVMEIAPTADSEQILDLLRISRLMVSIMVHKGKKVPKVMKRT